jgi:transposase
VSGERCHVEVVGPRIVLQRVQDSEKTLLGLLGQRAQILFRSLGYLYVGQAGPLVRERAMIFCVEFGAQITQRGCSPGPQVLLGLLEALGELRIPPQHEAFPLGFEPIDGGPRPVEDAPHLGGRVGQAGEQIQRVKSLDNRATVKYLDIMPPVDRHNPVRAKSSDSAYSLMEFMREFPDDESCLEHLWRSRWSPDGTHAECPKCKCERVFKTYATAQRRQSWTCTGCGHHVHPTAGTIFAKSSTSLHLWFYGMYLMASTRCGISAKQLERELGVSYRTAWRMLNKIRNQLMEQGDEPLSGDVEVDETAGGAKHVRVGDSRRGLAWVRKSNRPTIWGAVERGGRVRLQVVKSRGTLDVEGPIFEHVLPSSMIFTDEWKGYTNRVGGKYLAHKRIKHEDRVYVSGDVHTQTIEGVFSLMKNGIRGTYHSVSSRWLQGYLNEYAWRYSRRGEPGQSMFDALLEKAVE